VATAAERDELDQISREVAEVLARHRPALAELEQELGARRERLRDLEDRLRGVFEDTAFTAPARSVASRVDIDTSAMLYDSRRDWREQLTAFRAAKGTHGADGAGAA
jgi:hypothetical protein